MVRKIIDSEISIFLQIPSKEQISKIGGKDENGKNKTNIEAGNYITNDNKKPIVLYYKPNEDVNYIYGIEKLDMKKPMDTEFNKTIMDEYSRATHEIMVHPSDFIDLKTNGKITLTNEARVVNRNDGDPSNPFSKIVYIEGSEQKVKTKDGQEMYFLPGIFEHEVNTAIFEERTRDRTNPTGQGNVNVKFISVVESNAMCCNSVGVTIFIHLLSHCICADCVPMNIYRS